MADRGSRAGKHGTAEPTKRFPGYNEAGNKREFGSGEAGVKRYFVGSGLNTYHYIDPETGARRIIHADSADQARVIAKNDELILERDYKNKKRGRKAKKKR